MADDEGDPAWAALAGVERWAAEVRAREAADSRMRERWLRRSAEEEAELSGLLLDLAERRAPALVTTTSGRRHTGRLAAVGADFVALRSDDDRITLVALGALASVRATAPRPAMRSGTQPAMRSGTQPAMRSGTQPATGPGTQPATGPGTQPAAGSRAEARSLAVRVVDVLAHAVGRRPRVHLHCDAATVAGELRSVGTDVVTLRTDGDPSGLAYVSLASVSEISLLDSG